MQKLLTFFFSKNIRIDQSFNDTLANDIVSFEQLGPDIFRVLVHSELSNLFDIYTDNRCHGLCFLTDTLTL